MGRQRMCVLSRLQGMGELNLVKYSEPNPFSISVCVIELRVSLFPTKEQGRGQVAKNRLRLG